MPPVFSSQVAWPSAVQPSRKQVGPVVPEEPLLPPTEPVVPLPPVLPTEPLLPELLPLAWPVEPELPREPLLPLEPELPREPLLLPEPLLPEEPELPFEPLLPELLLPDEPEAPLLLPLTDCPEEPLLPELPREPLLPEELLLPDEPEAPLEEAELTAWPVEPELPEALALLEEAVEVEVPVEPELLTEPAAVSPPVLVLLSVPPPQPTASARTRPASARTLAFMEPPILVEVVVFPTRLAGPIQQGASIRKYPAPRAVRRAHPAPPPSPDCPGGGRSFGAMVRTLALLLPLLFSLVAGAAEPLRVHFLDVGQGDAALVITPSGRTLLIDAGNPEYATRLANRIRQLTTRPLDRVLLSHPHADHLGGMERALAARGAVEFWDPQFPFPSPVYERVLGWLSAHQVPVKAAKAGTTLDLGDGVTLELLWPGQPFLSGTRSDPNANSVVARLGYAGRHVLFTGDAEAETEQALVARRAPLAADVLKVPHHGSRHSSTPAFLSAVGASRAVISVGVRNDYGHPNAECLGRLTSRGAQVLRTDRDGEVRLEIDSGGAMRFTTGDLSGGGSSRTVEAPPEATPPPVQMGLGGPGFSDEPPPRHGHHDRKGKEKVIEMPSPGLEAGSGFVASRRGKVFHSPACEAVGKMKPDNVMHFGSTAEARAAGFEPAKDCHPGG